MSHITIVISKAAKPLTQAQAATESTEAVTEIPAEPAVAVTYTPDDGMTPSQIGSAVARLIKGIHKL